MYRYASRLCVHIIQFVSRVNRICHVYPRIHVIARSRLFSARRIPFFPQPSSLHFSLGRCSPFLMDLLTRAHKSSRPYNPVSIIFDYLGCALRVYNNIKKPYLVAQSRLYYIRSRSGAYIYIYILYYIRIIYAYTSTDEGWRERRSFGAPREVQRS